MTWVAGLSLVVLVWASAAAATVDPEHYDLNLAKGLVAFGEGRYESAVSLFSKALEAKPGDPEATYYLGQSLVRAKKYEAAEEVFRKLLEAEPASGRALLGLGIVRYNRDQYAEALASLAAAEKGLPDDPLVHYYQGLVYHKLEAFEQSPERFHRAMTLSPDLAPSAHYYSGVGYYRRGDLAKAKAEFEAVLAEQPGSELAQSAEEFLSLTTEVPAAVPRRWNLNFTVSAEWDSNVVLLPVGTSPPGGASGISQQADYRTVLFGSGEYRLIQTERWLAGVSYGTYQSFHRTLSGFDVEDNSPTAYVQHQTGPLRVSAQYIFNYTLVGRSPYLFAHAAQTLLTLGEGGSWLTQVQLRYQNKDFQHGRFPLNSARDGKNWLAGVTQYWLFAEKTGSVRVGYLYDTDRTGGGHPASVSGLAGTALNSDWAYEGHRVLAGLALPQIWTVKTDLAFSYYRQNYDNPNSFSADGLTRRRDRILSFTGVLSRPLTENLSMALQYAYTRDQTNVDVFDWNRSVYSFALTGQF